jgi:diguanylate cyclase (GGDEF)-like protein
MKMEIRGGLIDEVEFDRIDTAVKVVLRTSLPVLHQAYSFITVAIIRRDRQTMKPVWAEHSRRIKTLPVARKIIKDREVIRRDTDGGLMWRAVNQLSRQEPLPDGMTKTEDKKGRIYFIADGRNAGISDIIIPMTKSPTLSVFLAPILYKGHLVGMLAVDSIKANAFQASDESSKRRIEFLCALSTQLAAIVELLNGTYYDHLAGDLGVLTRAHFDEQFEKLRLADSLGFLAYFDLNRFKLVNEVHKHEGGNRVLKKFGKFARTQIDRSDLREEAWLYRFGGDEFALLIARKHTSDVTDFFDRLLKELREQPKPLCCPLHTLSSSVGVVSLNRREPAVKSVHKADCAMSWSKDIFRSRNRETFMFYDDETADFISGLDRKTKGFENRRRAIEDKMRQIDDGMRKIVNRREKLLNRLSQC